MTDVLIAGGGLAGSAAAIQLGRAGLTVELFERSQFPRDKPCGEGLMPAGVAALARLQLNKAPEGAPFLGIRYTSGKRVVEARFPSNDFPPIGCGYRRRVLDQAVFETARNTHRVKAHTGMRVEGPIIENGRICGLVVEGEPQRGSLVIAADGAHSSLRYKLGLDSPVRHKRIGMRTHFRLAPGQMQSRWVEIYLGNGFELYVTPLFGHELAVAALTRADLFDGSIEKQFRSWCNAYPCLAARLEGARQISDLQATAPLSGGARHSFLPGCILLGDAAGFTDPVTGGGMTQALLSAELLAQFAAHIFDDMCPRLEEFDRARQALLRDCRRLTDIMLWLTGHHSLVASALAILGRWPRLFSHLLGVSGSTRRLLGGELKMPIKPPHPKAGLGRKISCRAEYETDIF